MKNTAIYPGTFDPITFGHIDVIKKALKFVDKVIVGITEGSQKNFLFSMRAHKSSQKRTRRNMYFARAGGCANCWLSFFVCVCCSS